MVQHVFMSHYWPLIFRLQLQLSAVSAVCVVSAALTSINPPPVRPSLHEQREQTVIQRDTSESGAE